MVKLHKYKHNSQQRGTNMFQFFKFSRWEFMCNLLTSSQLVKILFKSFRPQHNCFMIILTTQHNTYTDKLAKSVH